MNVLWSVEILNVTPTIRSSSVKFRHIGIKTWRQILSILEFATSLGFCASNDPFCIDSLHEWWIHSYFVRKLFPMQINVNSKIRIIQGDPSCQSSVFIKSLSFTRGRYLRACARISDREDQHNRESKQGMGDIFGQLLPRARFCCCTL